MEFIRLLFWYRKSSSLPLPPPPTISNDGTVIVQPDNSNENESSSSSTTEKPKYFFAPLKSKWKMSTSSSTSGAAGAVTVDGKAEMRPDVLLMNNVTPSDGNRLATIRKPHNPLKYPSNTNAACIDPEVSSTFILFECFFPFPILLMKFSSTGNW